MINKNFFYYWTGISFHFSYILSVKSILKIEEYDDVTIYFNKPIPDDINISRSKYYWNYLSSLPVTIKEFCVRDFANDILPNKFYDLFEKYIQNTDNPYRHFHLSDIARYLILYEQGGIYQDFDTLTLKSLKPFIEQYDCYLPQAVGSVSTTFCGHRSPICNGNLASIRNHDFYRAVLLRVYDILNKEQKNLWTSENKIIFGPRLVATLLLQFTDIPVLDYKVFHSIGHKGKTPIPYYGNYYKELFDISDEAYVLHFHTGKTQSAYCYRSYRFPSDILKAREDNNFCFYHAKYIDENLLSWEKKIHDIT